LLVFPGTDLITRDMAVEATVTEPSSLTERTRFEDPMFGKKSGSLDVPPAAAKSRDAVEVARIWVADGSQHVVLRPEAWSDPAAWGILLVDVARHLARAYEEAAGRLPTETLARIRAGFDAEWEHATDEPKGKLLE
jgi:hypothetical protein